MSSKKKKIYLALLISILFLGYKIEYSSQAEPKKHEAKVPLEIKQKSIHRETSSLKEKNTYSSSYDSNKILIKLEQELHELPDVVYENGFVYYKKNIDEVFDFSKEDYSSSSYCHYKIQPNLDVVNVLTEQDTVSLTQEDSKSYKVLEYINNQILVENNPYNNDKLKYNCRIDMTQRFIIDSLF